MNQENKVLLTEGAAGKLIFHYAIPSVIGFVLYGMQNIIDGIVVGRFMGADGLASVNLITPLYSVVGVIAIMTGIGCQAIIGINLGSGRIAKAQDAITTGALFVFGCALVLSLLLLFFNKGVVSLLGADERLAYDSVQYLKGLVCLMPFIALMFYNDAMLKVTGHPRYALIVMVITIVLNTALNLLFIQVFKAGTFGVGFATGCAFTVGVVMSSLILLRKKHIISLQSGRFRLPLLKEMLYNGSSEGMSELSIGITLMIFNYTLMKYAGADGVAAFTIISYICFMGTMVFLGISDGIVPILSYNYGAGLYGRVQHILWYTLRINLIIGVAIYAIITVFSKTFITLFLGNQNPAVAEMAEKGAAIYAFAFIFSGINILFSSFYTALENAKYSLIISACRGLIFTMAGLFLYPVLWGITGVWLTVPVAEVITLFIVGLLYYHTRNIILLKANG